jgi:hypothetical protein
MSTLYSFQDGDEIMRVLGRKTKADMLAAVGIFGDTERCSFEPRVLADIAELEAAISRWEFVGIAVFIGVPPRVLLAVHLDSHARRAFDEMVSRLIATAVHDASFWTPRASRLAMVSGDRTIEASRG